MSMQKTHKISLLLHKILKRAGAWHQFIGSQDFPKYCMDNKDKSISNSVKLEMVYNEGGYNHD